MRPALLAEALGTFGIVFAPVALSASGKLPGGDGSLAAAAWASGLSVSAMIVAFGRLSGAHFNPAVSLALALLGRFPQKQLPSYALAQVLGGTLAAGVAALVFGVGQHGTHVPAASASLVAAVALEAVLTCLLLLLILELATAERPTPPLAPLVIGLWVVALVWIGGPLTGGSMNPARSLGPALISGGAALTHVWVYVLGPSLGALLATALHTLLHRPSR